MNIKGESFQVTNVSDQTKQMKSTERSEGTLDTDDNREPMPSTSYGGYTECERPMEKETNGGKATERSKRKNDRKGKSLSTIRRRDSRTEKTKAKPNRDPRTYYRNTKRLRKKSGFR